MNEETVHELLSRSAQEILETMFFVEPDAMSMDSQRPAGKLIATKMTFQGAPPGRFGLVVSEPLARTLASNFIGCEDAESLLPDQVADVVSELANIICGAVLSKMESGVNFDLSAPESVHVGTDEPGPDFNTGSPSICRLDLPEGALVSFLTFKEPV